MLASALLALGSTAASSIAAEPENATANRSPCSPDAGWDDPAPPQHVYGNTWYLGTCGVGAVLVSSKRGHILLDGTTEKSAAAVAANIVAAGFRVADVRYIVSTHAHRDHVGGIRQLQAWSGATVLGRGEDAAALLRGRGDQTDPQYQSAGTFPPVPDVKLIADGEVVKVGSLALTAHATPGHTPGGTSWTWTSCERRRCLRMVYADSLMAISDDDFRFGDEQANPGYLGRFRASIETVAALPCDILLTPHPGASSFWGKLSAGGRDKLIDPGACKRYAEFARQALESRLKRE